jgi:hypothetical protein
MFSIPFVQRREKQPQPLAFEPDLLARNGSPSGRVGFCVLWTEFGIGRSAEIKLQRPSPLTIMRMRNAKARGARG